jgi:nucleotide-binding universal stress UspA family protein
MLKPTKILVPTDFSIYSNFALKQALDIASEYGAEVYVLHVLEEKIHYAMDEEYKGVISVKSIKKLEKDLVKLANKTLNKQIEHVSSNNNVKIIPEVVLGIPYVEILRFQQEKGIDLVVISSIGHTGLARYFIGGVARIVLKGTTCPVLLTKGSKK